MNSSGRLWQSAPAGAGDPVEDEPTKGLDAEFKQVFAEILQSLLRQGVTLLMVSHDIEFCARYAPVALCFLTAPL